MHSLPKFFMHSSDRIKTDEDCSSRNSSGRSRGTPKLLPRLDRRNAAKNITYEFWSAGSSPSSSYGSEESIRARATDLYEGKTSFRIDGMVGEIDLICQTLGISGIDELTIPAEEYEAMKVRSSSNPLVFGRESESNCSDASESSGESDVAPIDLTTRTVVRDEFCVGCSDNCTVSDFSGKIREGSPDLGVIINKTRPSNLDISVLKLSNWSVDNLVVDNVTLNNFDAGSNEFHGSTIKGVRPPVLSSPPLMLLPMDDKESSASGILNSFALERGVNSSGYDGGFFLEVVEVTQDDISNGKEVDEDMQRTAMREENCVLRESCSSTSSSKDDDSSSSVSDPSPNVSPAMKSEYNIVDWQKGELLGRGSFGSVYEAIDSHGFFFAVKEVSLLDQDDEGKQRISQLEQEIALLSQFEHENIVQYYGAKKDDSHLYIFLQLVTKGSLFSLYQKYNLQDSQVSIYTRQILQGLKYLHDRNVVHRDIKCANILVDTLGSVKLADFGLAKATKLNDVKSCRGTAFWMAPEVVRSRGYGLAADIWSLGCTVLEMLTRRFPYPNLECMPALFRIGRGERPPIPDSLSLDSRDFILSCLQADPSLRPTAAQLLDHPFVKRTLL